MNEVQERHPCLFGCDNAATAFQIISGCKKLREIEMNLRHIAHKKKFQNHVAATKLNEQRMYGLTPMTNAQVQLTGTSSPILKSNSTELLGRVLEVVAGRAGTEAEAIKGSGAAIVL